jgi:hypothetical protein
MILSWKHGASFVDTAHHGVVMMMGYKLLLPLVSFTPSIPSINTYFLNICTLKERTSYKMCRIRTIHFTLHDTRRLISTQLFSSPTKDVYVMDANSRVCDCGRNAARNLFRMRENTGRQPNIIPCVLDHPCCLCYQEISSRCHDWLNMNWLPTYPDNPEDGFQDPALCPNALWTIEYQHLSTLLHPKGNKLPDEDEPWEHIPAFPAGDIFYSDEITNGAANHPDSRGLHADRALACKYGVDMHLCKLKLRDAIDKADSFLLSLEEYLLTSEQDRDPLDHEQRRRVVDWCKTAHNLVWKVEWMQLEAARCYVRAMKHASFVLEVLQRMPAPGDRVYSLDGRCSFSREQLDHANLTPREAVAACSGPLKQHGALHARLMDAVGRVLRLNAGRHLSPDTTMQRRGSFGDLADALPASERRRNSFSL